DPKMAFLGGAECSTAGNPLSQFTKHVQDDKSLQRDRLVGNQPGLQESFRTQRNGASEEAAMQEFLQDTNQIPQDVPRHFGMEHIQRELDAYELSAPDVLSPAWRKRQDQRERARLEAHFGTPQNPKPGFVNPRQGSSSQGFGPQGFSPQSFSPAEFQRFQQLERTQSPAMARPSQMSGYRSSMGMGMGYGMNGAAVGNQLRSALLRPGQQNKGKDRMVELDDQDWEKQFAAFDAAGKAAQEQDLDAEARNNIDAEMDTIDRSVLLKQFTKSLEGPWPESFGPFDFEPFDFEGVWQGIQAENADYARDVLNDDYRFNDKDLDDYLNDVNRDMHTWDSFDGVHDHFRDPQLGDYLFEDSNIFSNAKDPFSEGTRIMHEGGNLSLAALAFEAAVQKDPDHLAAWVSLGNAQAQNEKETPALRALEQAIKLDPNNLAALMGLAISYTNEGYDSTAYRTLERWLSTKYPDVLSPDQVSAPAELGFTDRHLLHDKVTNHFIRAAQLSPQGEHMDPDVQVGLGVLFYGAEEYAKAVDCFEAALSSHESGISNDRSQIHLLYNRLGATLANSGRSEEAIAAYEQALRMAPGFVRARYNLGVSCINIGCQEEAAGHLLGALSMHRVVEREGAERVREVVGEDTSGGSGNGGLREEDLQRMASLNQ
ncbi:MAG: hypothetical protein Q9174_006519, partial [Haloplaca sp. 1 TL-2023]